VQFTGTGGTASGEYPNGSLTVSGGSLFGMTYDGGANGYGNVFSVGANGTNYQNLVSFTGSSGTANGFSAPGNVTLVGSGLYGMTLDGGANSIGNVFSVGVNGTNYQNLVSFTGSGGTASGAGPLGSLTLVGSGLYGMTNGGGADGYGNLFSVGTDGTSYQDLVSFTGTGGTASGGFPQESSLTLVGSGLYGMTIDGGAGGYCNLFSVGTDGTGYQNLLSFTGSGGTASGWNPYGSLTLAGTRLYGMTNEGGAGGYGNLFSVGTDGTGYQNLVPFTGSSGTASGAYPQGSLILSGTALYGLTQEGGANGVGNIFSVGTDGSDYQDHYDFTGGTDGAYPLGDLTLSNGTLFGMAEQGGTSGLGTVFALALPSPTPEPGTLALAGGGAAIVLAAYRWRRRRHLSRMG
jgi:hypothetical protein